MPRIETEEQRLRRIEWQREYRRTHPEAGRKDAARARAHEAANPGLHAKRSRDWTARNPERKATQGTERYAMKMQRRPVWYGELDALVMLEAHHLKRLRSELVGGDWHVDHVVPMQGKTVSGLHVWNNVQVIPAAVNLRKHNQYV